MRNQRCAVRSTMPPLKRKIKAGSAKMQVVFCGGPWDGKHAWLAETVTNTGPLKLGDRAGSYAKAPRAPRHYGRRQSGPPIYEYDWKPAPLNKPKSLADLAI